MQLCVNLLKGPGQSHAVLALLQTGYCNTACVCSFTRHEEDLLLYEQVGSFSGGRHVCTLCYCEAAVCDQSLCVIQIQLVLGCTRKGDITWNGPDTLRIFCSRNSVNVLFDSAATTFLDLFYNIQLDAVRIIYIAVGITHSNNLSTKCLSLLYCVDCYISRTGYQNSLAGQLFAIVL